MKLAILLLSKRRMDFKWAVAVLALAGVAHAGGYDAFNESERAPVAVEQLPAPVRAALELRAGGRKVAHVEQVTFSDGHVAYQAEIRRRAHDPREVEISPAGEILGEWIKPARRGTGP
jgi:hypothetical protein